jgi:DNA-binding NarL/FixJ family response regulator
MTAVGSAMPANSGADAPASQSSLRVVLVDDDELTREGLRVLLSSRRDRARLVGTVPASDELLPMVDELDADVVLSEVRPQRSEPLELVARLASIEAHFDVVVYTYEDEVSTVFRALSVGASGYLLKSLGASELEDSMVRIRSGEVVVDPTIATRIAMDAAQRGGSEFWPGSQLGLTRRESDVTRLLANGLSNRAIAAELIVGEETVKTHLRKIYRKLGVKDRAQAVARVLREGLFD